MKEMNGELNIILFKTRHEWKSDSPGSPVRTELSFPTVASVQQHYPPAQLLQQSVDNYIFT